MEICKAHTLRLKALNKHNMTHIMYIFDLHGFLIVLPQIHMVNDIMLPLCLHDVQIIASIVYHHMPCNQQQ